MAFGYECAMASALGKVPGHVRHHVLCHVACSRARALHVVVSLELPSDSLAPLEVGEGNRVVGHHSRGFPICKHLFSSLPLVLPLSCELAVLGLHLTVV